MTINGPTPPNGINKTQLVDAVSSSSKPEEARVVKTDKSNEILEVQEPPNDKLTFNEMIEKAAQLVPPEQREEFIKTVQELSETDPILSSMKKRLGGDNK